MGLRDYFNKLLNRKAVAAPSEEEIPMAYVDAVVTELIGSWQTTDDRKRIYDDIDRMDAEDEFVSMSLDVLTSDVLAQRELWDEIIGIKCEDEGLTRKIQDILTRSKVKDNLKNDIRGLIKGGNRFGEAVYSPGMQFKYLHPINQAWSVFINQDKHGVLMGGDPLAKKINFCAYDQRDNAGGFLAGFWPYQILHWRVSPVDAHGHGTPHLKSARRNWLRLQKLEDYAAVARLIRAYLKYVHYVPVSDLVNDKMVHKAINQYKKSMLKAEINSISGGVLQRSQKNNPYDVATDFFIPVSETSKGRVEMLDPTNTQLTNLADLEYAQNRLMGRLIVPKARMNLERDVNAKATLVLQNTAYGSSVLGFQYDYVRPLTEKIKFWLFLEGVDIDRAEFAITMPSPYIRDAKEDAEIADLMSKAEALAVKAGISSRSRIRKEDHGLTDEESQAEELEILREKTLFPDPVSSFGGLFGKGGDALPNQVEVRSSQIPVLYEVMHGLYDIRKKLKGNGK